MRNSQGVHNVAMEKDCSLLQSSDYFDAQLITLGWQQVYAYFIRTFYEPTYLNTTFT